MRVLVTGAAGFIAPHVVQIFQQAGDEVRETDVRTRSEISDVVVADLTSDEDTHRVTEGIDVVCHLGGVGDVYLAAEKPELAASANVVGTAMLLRACHQRGVQRFIYASTWEVYGRPVYEPMDELHPCSPDHPYSITKLAGEQLVMAYNRLKGLAAVSLRLGTAYGPGMRPNSVFSLFIRQAVDGQPIRITGSGDQTREFTHVSDIARAFYLAATSPIRGEVINVVASEAVSIRQLAAAVVDELPTEVAFGPPREGDVASARVSSIKAEQLLQWKPTVDFKDGLRQLIRWYLERQESLAPLNAEDP